VIKLTDTEGDQVAEALRLSLIYMQEHPSDNSPVKELRKSLKIMSESMPEIPDTEEVPILQMILEAIFDEECGATLRPDPVVVERIKTYLGNVR
jgi:hypothetical protein